MFQSQLLSTGSYTNGGTGVSTLADLGVTMNSDGTLTLDTSTLDSAVANNQGAVQGFFQGTTSNNFAGFSAFLATQLDSFTDPSNGAFTIDLQSIGNETTDVKSRISTFETYLNAQTVLLTNEYSQADLALQQLPLEEQQLNAELGISNNSNNGN
jgi:flagellar hook-associated protein 2